MKASDLIAEVQRITDNDDYSDADILTILNRGVFEIAGGGDRQHGFAKVAPLPDLIDSEDITVTEARTDLPATYHRGVMRVTIAGEKLKKYDNLGKLLDDYEGQIGTPEAYCIKGSSVWLYPIPSTSTTATVYFYRFPVDMEGDNDTPDGIPASLHYKLLVNYTCREIYAEVESGVDLAHPDMEKHDLLYNKALTDLERFIGPEEGEPTNIDDDYYTEDNIF